MLWFCALQHAISVEALQYLENQTDAKGRCLEVIKMPLPPPLHISEEESAGVAKVEGSAPREVRPSASVSCQPCHLHVVHMVPLLAMLGTLRPRTCHQSHQHGHCRHGHVQGCPCSCSLSQDSGDETL